MCEDGDAGSPGGDQPGCAYLYGVEAGVGAVGGGGAGAAGRVCGSGVLVGGESGAVSGIEGEGRGRACGQGIRGAGGGGEVDSTCPYIRDHTLEVASIESLYYT